MIYATVISVDEKGVIAQRENGDNVSFTEHSYRTPVANFPKPPALPVKKNDPLKRQVKIGDKIVLILGDHDNARLWCFKFQWETVKNLYNQIVSQKAFENSVESSALGL